MNRKRRFIVTITLPKQIERGIQTLREKFDPKNAFKIPPHITLKRPFLTVENVETIEKNLKEVASSKEQFQIKLNGLGQFTEPNKVIFVNVERSQSLTYLQKEISDSLESLIEEQGIKYPFTPHVTLGSGLTEGKFQEIKKELTDFTPTIEFSVLSFFLFEFRDKNVWQPLREFRLTRKLSL